MISRLHLGVILAIAAVLWGALLVLDGVLVSLSWLRPFSTVLGVLVLLLFLFDVWGWRLRILHPWFVSVPDLRGTWKGELSSGWIDPVTKVQIAPLEAYLVIRQTLSNISVRLITKESSSELLTGSIVQAGDGTCTIAGTYRNTPKLSVRDRSPIHHGGLLLRVQGDPPGGLEGQYWTDRGTKGELRFRARSKRCHDDFDGAAAAEYA